MDNNRAEQAIRPFTIGRKNWVVTDTIAGTRAGAIYYSIIETAKANNLRLVNYLEFILTELCNHQKDTGLDFIEDLLPWNPEVQKRFIKDNPKEVNCYGCIRNDLSPKTRSQSGFLYAMVLINECLRLYQVDTTSCNLTRVTITL